MARRICSRQSQDSDTEHFAMKQSNGKHGMPTWLDGRTIAMLTTTITVALTLGTMIQTAHSRLGTEIGQLRQDMGGLHQELRQDMGGLRQELRDDMGGLRQELRDDMGNLRHELRDDMGSLRQELRADIEKLRTDLGNDINRLDDRLRSVEVGVAAIRTAVVGLDSRLRVVEQHARHADETPGPDQNDG